MPDVEPRSGGRILVDALVANHVDRVFCVPGESYLDALDAMYDTPSIDVCVARNEGGAAYMADAHGKLTGRPGICFVTRGPGAANASGGLHMARQDSTPLIMFVGQVARGHLGREAFQEIDYRQMFGQVTKWVAQIDDPSRIPELVNRAFATATSGRPGPVVLAVPEDMLADTAAVGDLPAWQPVTTHPAAGDVARAVEALSSAARPLVVVGGKPWDEQARLDLERFASAWNVPVATSFRCQDYIDNDHPSYAGDLGIAISPALTQRVKDADLLLVVGARLGEFTTRGYSLVDIPRPRQQIVHVHADAQELGSVYFPALAINASPSAFVAELARTTPEGRPTWAAETDRAHGEFVDWNTPVEVGGDVQLGEIFGWLAGRLEPDAIVCNGAGNYTGWVHRFHRFHRFGTQLAPTNGAMGYGTPAAVAAKLAHPERTVVAVAGDGCFMMNGQELATAVQYNAAIVVIVVNNSMLGTIRMHQERRYPNRVVATTLRNPDFAMLATAYGAHSELVTSTREFAPAFERALAANRPALIEVRVDPDLIAHNTTLSQIQGDSQ